MSDHIRAYQVQGSCLQLTKLALLVLQGCRAVRCSLGALKTSGIWLEVDGF